jgi:predicted nucleic acid-binding protein
LKKLKIYVETSVIGGLIDREPPGRHELARAFLDAIIGGDKFDAFVSVLVIDEIMRAPAQLVQAFHAYLSAGSLSVLERTEEADALARRYVTEGVISERDFNDALHLAIATVNGMDLVVSWNFSHMVNVERIRGINGVNMLAGYPQIDVRSPEEVWNETGR